jgi:diaminopimelate decarboxylase
MTDPWAREVAQAVLERRDELLASIGSTPAYLFDGSGFRAALDRFRSVFDARLHGHRSFFAMKSNPHPLVVRGAVDAGFGLDASSGRELRQALAATTNTGARIVFSGPAKSREDHDLALLHADRVTVLVDSAGELRRLGEAVQTAGRPVNAGLRISAGGDWAKFGVPAERFRALQVPEGVRLRGLQFHVSWNRDPEPYRRMIELVAPLIDQIDNQVDSQAGELTFLDVGGGYRPHRLEGEFPDFTVKPSVPLEAYADGVAAAVQRAGLRCAIWTEPGRILSTFAMHLVMRVVDKKSDSLVILDGGIHMVGWERYQAIVHPVVNLDRPSLDEQVVRLGGSLCDCEDTLGERVFGAGIEEGDRLLIPFQGAYSFTTAQNFIRDIPPVLPIATPSAR